MNSVALRVQGDRIERRRLRGARRRRDAIWAPAPRCAPNLEHAHLERRHVGALRLDTGRRSALALGPHPHGLPARGQGLGSRLRQLLRRGTALGQPSGAAGESDGRLHVAWCCKRADGEPTVTMCPSDCAMARFGSQRLMHGRAWACSARQMPRGSVCGISGAISIRSAAQERAGRVPSSKPLLPLVQSHVRRLAIRPAAGGGPGCRAGGTQPK